MKRAMIGYCLVLVLLCAACGTKAAPDPVLPDGATEMTVRELGAAFGMDFSYLAGYEAARAFLLDTVPPVAVIRFLYHGDTCEYRVATPSGWTDLAGLAAPQTQTLTAVKGREARLTLDANGAGALQWYDVVPGVMYALVMPQNATEEKLESAAGRLFVPVQGEVAGDEDRLVREWLESVHASLTPGTAGSSLQAAALAGELLDLCTDYSGTVGSFTQVLQRYKAHCSDETESALLADQLDAVAAAGRSLLENGTGILTGAGYRPTHEHYDPTVLRPYLDALL